MKGRKKILTGMMILAVVVSGQFMTLDRTAQPALGMKQVEAFSFWNILNAALPSIEGLEAERQELLQDLADSALLKAHASSYLNEAIHMNPELMQAEHDAFMTLSNDRTNIRAAQRLLAAGPSAEDIQARAYAFEPPADPADYQRVQDLLKKSAAARRASNDRTASAIAHAGAAIAIAVQLINQKDNAQTAIVAAQILDTINPLQEVLAIQREQSKRRKDAANILEKKMNVKEPSKKEARNLAKELLPQ